MTLPDSAAASDSFGIVSTPVPSAIEPAPIQPAEPTKRKASGRVDFPGGIYLAAPGTDMRQTPIFVTGVGWLSVGVAQQLAASLAGAVAEAAQQETREARLRP